VFYFDRIESYANARGTHTDAHLGAVARNASAAATETALFSAEAHATENKKGRLGLVFVFSVSS
jgi:hypothetical protein